MIDFLETTLTVAAWLLFAAVAISLVCTMRWPGPALRRLIHRYFCPADMYQCPSCYGSGHLRCGPASDKWYNCNLCDGLGAVTEDVYNDATIEP